jgi:hypothetical protein
VLDGSVFSCADGHLQKLDDVQSNFFNKLGIKEDEAYLVYNFVPHRLRRCIGALGLIHNCVLGAEQGRISQFVPRDCSYRVAHLARGSLLRHSKQLVDHCGADALDYLGRSMLGVICILNLLPQSVVDAASVPRFQSAVSKMAPCSALRSLVSKDLFCHVRSRHQPVLSAQRTYAHLVFST